MFSPNWGSTRIIMGDNIFISFLFKAYLSLRKAFVIGYLLSFPNDLAVSFTPGADCLLLYSDNNNNGQRDEYYPATFPDSINILGTDNQGRDVFSRLIYGLKVSLTFETTHSTLHLKRIRKPYLSLATKNGKKVKKVKKIVFKKKK